MNFQNSSKFLLSITKKPACSTHKNIAMNLTEAFLRINVKKLKAL